MSRTWTSTRPSSWMRLTSGLSTQTSSSGCSERQVCSDLPTSASRPALLKSNWFYSVIGLHYFITRSNVCTCTCMCSGGVSTERPEATGHLSHYGLRKVFVFLWKRACLQGQSHAIHCVLLQRNTKFFHLHLFYSTICGVYIHYCSCAGSLVHVCSAEGTGIKNGV